MSLLLLPSMLAPLMAGLFLVLLLWPNQKKLRYSFIIKGSIASGLGFGVSSIFFFLWLLIFGSNNNFPVFEKAFLVFLALAILCTIKMQSKMKLSEIDRDAFLGKKEGKAIDVVFCVVFLSALAAFLVSSLRSPHGEWDGWAVWNMHARFIYRGGEYWKDVFTNLLDWSHPDYPLLIPLSIAQGWEFIGSEKTIIPIFLAMCFTFSTILLVFSSLTALRSKGQGLLAGLLLSSTPFFIRCGAYQYADVPLGFFFLSTIVLLTFYDRLPMKNRNLLFLAGMAAGFSAWTKNEGFLFLAAIVATRLFLIAKTEGLKKNFKDMGVFSIGIMPILIAIIYFKINIAPPNDILSAQGFGSTVDKLKDFSRYFQVLKAYVFESIKFTRGIVGLPLLVVYLSLVGIEREGKNKISILTAVISLSLMFIGYFFVYIVTHQDLAWHLKYSLNRLFLQLWPSFVFCFFMIVKTPERFLSKNVLD